MNAQECFTQLAPYINHMRENITNVPLEKNDRAMLATMIAGSFCSLAHDCCMESIGEVHLEKRVESMKAMFTLIEQSLRATHGIKSDG